MTEPRTEDAPAAALGGADRAARRLRQARWIVYGSFCVVPAMMLFFAVAQILVYVANDLVPPLLALLGATSPWSTAVVLAPTLVLAWLTLRLATVRLGRPLTRHSAVLNGSFALLFAALALLDVDAWSMTLAGLWWSVAMLVATRRQRVGFTAVLLLAPVARLPLYPDPNPALMALVLGYACVFGLLLLTANLAVLWLWEIAHEATSAREAQARLAVTEERLRFARDMHDLVGHSLSGIAVKSELAARLAARDPGRAAVEMASVQQVARDALREVRAAVSGYRDVDLAAELASVRSVLTAAGARVRVTGAEVELPPEPRTLAAWIVREGATNVLRHSAARSCDITLTRQERSFVVEFYNDGARAGEQPPFGNGLTGLAERVAAVGGALSATLTGDGGFLLRAVLPLREDPVRPEPRRKGVAA